MASNPKAVTRRNTQVGTRVQAFAGASHQPVSTGTVTKVKHVTTGQGFKVKVRWDARPGNRFSDGTQESWVTSPGLVLEVLNGNPNSKEQ